MPAPITRRQILVTAAATLPIAKLLGCASSDPGGGGGTLDATTGGMDATAMIADAAPAADANEVADAGVEEDTGTTPDSGEHADADEPDSGTASGWATGGTASMSGNYPDPFAAGPGPVCELTCAQTLGPCYVQTISRKDVSEGQNGLPVRLAFLVVDDACNPVANAEVDIWHTSATGFYSGNEAPVGCTLGNAEAAASRWFRGVQVTGANGRVDFDTCFPGWYSGRTIHIHFTVRAGGVEYLTSQLYFEDALCDEIVGGEPIYSDRGARNTRNGQDGIFPRTTGADYIFQTSRQADGAMLAWKTLVLRASTATPLCQAT